MIKLPNKKNSFEFENNFYFTCNNDRISKIIIQYELFLKTQKREYNLQEIQALKNLQGNTSNGWIAMTYWGPIKLAIN